MRYYHAADKSYREGEPLYSYDTLCRQGRPPAWKWDQVYARTDVVCMTRILAEAQRLQERFPEQVGPILIIELSERFEREHVIWNEEGLPCVRDCIPPQYIRRYDPNTE